MLYEQENTLQKEVALVFVAVEENRVKAAKTKVCSGRTACGYFSFYCHIAIRIHHNVSGQSNRLRGDKDKENKEKEKHFKEKNQKKKKKSKIKNGQKEEGKQTAAKAIAPSRSHLCHSNMPKLSTTRGKKHTKKKRTKKKKKKKKRNKLLA